MATHADTTVDRDRLQGPGLERELEKHRRALTGYCYRMVGSWFEAEDAVQETMIRAWKSVDKLDNPAALRSWLYRIATNVCYDMLQGAQRRARPMDLASPVSADTPLPQPRADNEWIQPAPDARIAPEGADPAELLAFRETVKLAFVAALQMLPPKQRAVLILREVLRWQASEVAELLDTSVASVNSALQRARATLDATEADADTTDASTVVGEEGELLQRYVTAFEAYDVEQLVTLLAEDAQWTMPPHDLWLVGREQAAAWMLGQGIACKDAKVLVTEGANGTPAFGSYKPAPEGGFAPFALVVLEMSDGQVSGAHHFLYPELFPAFGLPRHLDD